MSRFYANVLPRAHPSHYQPQSVNAVQYMHPAPHTVPVSRNSPPSDFDSMIKERFTKTDDNFRYAISCLHLHPENIRQLSDCVKHLRIYKNLFMHTYVHLVSCCQTNPDRLLEYVNEWVGWGSVKQLACHSLIRDPLIDLWKSCKCNQHKFLLDRHFVIDDDDSYLLCLLLYCSKVPALYELHRKPAVRARHGDLKESEQVIELLWQFIMKHQGNEDEVRRLRACIYRMARKYAYLPHDLQIRDHRTSNKQDFGRGTNGVLTKVRMEGKDVIIKKIPGGNRVSQRKHLEMFASEAILWGTLRHKNIVPFIGVITEGFNMGLISPFFKNGDVRNFMNRQDPRDRLAWAGRLGRDLAEALEYIHSHEPPIIHGDIKGDNVLVDDNGRACLGDFGQSHASDSGKYLDSTRVGDPKCPYNWMAPEIMQGERTKSSDKSDIYSFGCVLYEMVSGEFPFQGLAENQVTGCVLRNERPSRPGSISRDHPLWRVINACWKHHPEDRPPAEQLVRLLR